MATDSPEDRPAGLWSLVGGELREIARWDVGPASVLVPTEDVLLLAVELPLAGTARRRAALPFMVEDRIAAPLDAVHIALGGALAKTTYLVGVVRHDIMAGWAARLGDAGLDHASIVPDALLLPVPAPGHWHVAGAADRLVVRTDTGIGLAVPAGRFAAVRAAGGSLPCIVFGPPPVDLPMATAAAAGPDVMALASPPLDLRAGPYAPPPRALPRTVRRAAAVVGLGLLAHTALLAADARAAATAAAHRRTRTEALMRATLPGAILPGAAHTVDLDRLLPAGHGRLLPLLARAAAALQPVGGLGWSKLGWSATDDRLTLGVEAGDIGGLQRAQAALAAAGLDPASGAVTAGENRAEGEFVVRGRDA